MDENMMVNNENEMEEQETSQLQEDSYGIGAIVLVSAVAVGGIFLAVKGAQMGWAYAKKHFFKPKKSSDPIEAEAVDSQEDES